jgi:hypothetical protein
MRQNRQVVTALPPEPFAGIDSLIFDDVLRMINLDFLGQYIS